MAEKTSNTAANIKKIFHRFSTSRKAIGGFVVLVSIVVIIIIINLASTLTYGVLYANLSTGDSGLIIEQLKERKVPYRLSAGGGVIEVPDDRAADLRLELAAAGLPGDGGVGVELFTNTFQKFAKKNNFFFSPDVFSTSAAGPLNGWGCHPLFDKTAPATSHFAQNIEYIRAIERELAGKIIALLEPHVGAGKVRADVKLKLNFDKMETTEEKVDPDSLAKVSEKSESSSTATSKSKSEKSHINYEVSKKITRLTKPIGEIERISAAVVIDDVLVDVREQAGELVKQSRRRTVEELEAIKKIAQAAVGFDSQRGDVIEVANLAFDTSTEKMNKIYQEIYKPTTAGRVERFFSTPPGIAVIIFFIILIIFLLRKRLFRGFSEITGEARLPKPGEVEISRDSEKIYDLREAKDEAEIERELREKYKVARSTKKMIIIRDKVKRFASENKDETASLVKSFLFED